MRCHTAVLGDKPANMLKIHMGHHVCGEIFGHNDPVCPALAVGLPNASEPWFFLFKFIKQPAPYFAYVGPALPKILVVHCLEFFFIGAVHLKNHGLDIFLFTAYAVLYLPDNGPVVHDVLLRHEDFGFNVAHPVRHPARNALQLL